MVWKAIGSALVWAAVGAAFAAGAEEKDVTRAERPLMLAYYYTWYTTGYGPHGHWSMWTRQAPCTYFEEGTDPEKIVYGPGIRHISSCGYPLIGPYDSDNPEVVRWHIRLAKAAGIDAFLVDVWGELIDVASRSLLEVILPIAEEEGFKICVCDEAPQFNGDIDQNVGWAVNFLNRCKDSPAYLRIDGKPVYYVYQVWDGRMTPDDGRRYIRGVEEQAGDVYWIFDRIVARPGGPEGDSGFALRDGWAEIEDIDAFSLYATFSVVRETRPLVLEKWYRDIADRVHASGRRVMLPVHPGLDSRKIQKDEVAEAEGTSHWIIPREEGRTLRGYLHAATSAGADFIAVTSFNEWPETTVVEPSLTWPDPYLYLKILADHNRVPWIVPNLPPDTALDPLIRPYHRVRAERPREAAALVAP